MTLRTVGDRILGFDAQTARTTIQLELGKNGESILVICRGSMRVVFTVSDESQPFTAYEEWESI